ncbi:MAG: hypothetical protein ACK5SK_09375 [Cyclobacteriaceae bacterium]
MERWLNFSHLFSLLANNRVVLWAECSPTAEALAEVEENRNGSVADLSAEARAEAEWR